MSATARCQEINAALEALTPCIETDSGTRFTTHCLYPSFDPVAVFVIRYGEGYRIGDGGGAMRVAWDHGRDISAARRLIAQYGASHNLEFKNDVLFTDVSSPEWLVPAILTVANTSSVSGHAVLEAGSSISKEDTLKRMIGEVLNEIAPKKYVKDFEMRGKSGKVHHFHYALRPSPERAILLDAVKPHPNSIASKYMAFSDTRDFEPVIGRLAVYDQPLDQDDVSLLQEVAEIIPFTSLNKNIRKRLDLPQ